MVDVGRRCSQNTTKIDSSTRHWSSDLCGKPTAVWQDVALFSHSEQQSVSVCVCVCRLEQGTGQGSDSKFKQLRVQTAGGKPEHL